MSIRVHKKDFSKARDDARHLAPVKRLPEVLDLYVMVTRLNSPQVNVL